MHLLRDNKSQIKDVKIFRYKCSSECNYHPINLRNLPLTMDLEDVLGAPIGTSLDCILNIPDLSTATFRYKFVGYTTRFWFACCCSQNKNNHKITTEGSCYNNSHNIVNILASTVTNFPHKNLEYVAEEAIHFPLSSKLSALTGSYTVHRQCMWHKLFILIITIQWGLQTNFGKTEYLTLGPGEGIVTET